MTKLHNLLKQVVNSKKTNLNENKRHGVAIWLSIVCLLFFISMVACAPTTSSDDSGGNQIITDLTYPSATFGTGGTITPDNTPSQATSYTLTYALGGTVTPPVIDATTGDITTTANTTAGVYSVKALDENDKEITTSSFTVTYVPTNKADLEREIKGTDATGRAAWRNTGNFNYIDTSRVTDMANLFDGDSTFNGDISNWDVRSVTSMQSMFSDARAFNQDIGGWDVKSVTSMGSMFNTALIFNQDIRGWDVRSVTTMQSMFTGASAFNQDLQAWGEHLQGSAVITAMFTTSGVGINPLPTWCTSDKGCYSTVLTYPSSATFGTGGIITPVNTPSQATSYTLTYALGRTVTPPTINPNTGIITTIATTTAGFYSVKALDESGNDIATSSFTVTYVALNKADLEMEIKSSTATGRKAWGDTGNFN